MEYVFDCDVIGEILIPLENYMEQKISDQKFIDLSKLTEKTFKDFRSILFQGELLRFFLLAKIDTPQNNSEFFDNLFVKFEFDPSCDFNSTVGSDSDINQGYECNVSIPEVDNDSSILTSDLTKLHLIEPFSLHRNSLYKPIQNGKSMSSSNNYQNVNYDIISRRHFIEEKNILIFEIIRNIVIPNNFLNKSLIMKLHLMKKNKIDHLYDGSYNLLDIYSSGVYNEVKEFTILKTLFKEVKVIRPIYISKINQIDILPDYSFLQLKIENITSSINFLDKSLKVSRFLKLTQEEEYLGFGINLLIKDIHILKEETIVLNKSNIHYKKLENILQEKIGFGINNFDFQLLNSEIPIEIKPGEEIVISIKITKPSFNINQKMNNKAMTKEMKPENFQVTSTVGSSGNNQNKVLSNTQFPLQTREDSIDKRASAFERITTQQSIRSLQNPIPISSMQRSATISQITPSSSTLFNPLMTNDKINKTVPLNSYPTIISEGSQTANYDLEDIIKVTMSTPLVLNIVSYKFYDTLFITVPLKWQNEIYRCIKLELEIQDKIKVHEYFNVTLRLKNMSINIMEIELEISDSSTDFINQQDLLDNITSNVKNSDDEIPSILSEIKNKYIGILNSNEEKILDIRFLAVKKGFHNLTSFSLLDKVSGKKFDFVYPNKIYID